MKIAWTFIDALRLNAFQGGSHDRIVPDKNNNPLKTLLEIAVNQSSKVNPNILKDMKDILDCVVVSTKYAMEKWNGHG